MRKPNQGTRSSGNASARSSENIGSYSKSCSMGTMKQRPALVKVNEHPMDGSYMGFATPKTLMK